MTQQRALRLVRSLGRDEQAARGAEFITPLLKGGSARLRIQGLIYSFSLPQAQPGWWVCQVVDAFHAEVIAEALPWQRGDYLALFPSIRLILLTPLSETGWMALPEIEVKGQEQHPVIVQLTEHAQPFTRIIGRVEGTTIWYDDLDRDAAPQRAERLRGDLADGKLPGDQEGLTPFEAKAYQMVFDGTVKAREDHELKRVGSRAREALDLTGARLLDVEKAGKLMRIKWEYDGHQSVTLVDGRLNVQSAGICLSGEDRKFDLASIVGVVAESPWFNRNNGR